MDLRSRWCVNIAYRAQDGALGLQTFIVRAHSRAGALGVAWKEARTAEAAARRRHGRLIIRLRNLRAIRVPE